MSSTSADESGARDRKGRSDSASDADDQQGPSQPPSKWRTPRAQEAYSSKLLDTLRLARAGGATTNTTTPARGRAVRDAAYRALAVAARGQSRWSRAILARRRRGLQLPRARLVPRAIPSSRPGSGQSVASKARALGRLVPGCRRLSLPALLAEVSDYIAALEMQVHAMNQLAEDLAAASASTA